MFSSKSLLLLTSLLLVAIMAFVTFTGPLSINGLSNLVRNQLSTAQESEYIPPAITIEENNSIERYRMRMTLSNIGSDRWPDYVTGEGAYVVAPHAEELTIIYEENETQQQVTMTVITDTYYLQDGGLVIQTPSPGLELRQLTLLDPQDATTLANNFVQIEEEAINDRNTIHYQGDAKSLPSDNAAALDMFDNATIDLWIDKEENSIVAMAMRAYGVDGNPDGIYEMRLDYFDFNNPDIVITPPELTTEVPEE